MNLKKELYNYHVGYSSLSIVTSEFILISLLSWAKFNFLVGVITFLSLIILSSIPKINKIMYLLFVAFWTIIAFFLSYSNFSFSTTIGISMLVFVFSAGIHFSACDLSNDVDH